MTLWISLVIMCLLATLFVAWPLYRRHKRLSPLNGGAVVAIVAVSAGLYALQGSPELESGSAAAVPNVDEMVAALAARLESEPDDVVGWTMLGRSYMTLNNFSGAVDAYERAVALESAENAQTLVGLGEAILARDNGRIEGRTSALFESALALEPNNATALFYGGIGALNRGNNALAADRWEILLGLNPPPEIQQVLVQRIAEWRGEPPPAQQPSVESPGAVVTADVSVSAAAAASLPSDATVFIIARDPAQPSPPIAVTRRRLSELPDAVALGDGDSMIPGRSLSGFPEFELIARVSLSGQPIEQSGDWFGAQIVKPAESDAVKLSIERQVP